MIYENEYGAYEQGSLSQMKDLVFGEKLDVDLQSVEDLVLQWKILKNRSTIKSLKEEGRDTAKRSKTQKQLKRLRGHKKHTMIARPYADAAANDWFDRIQGHWHDPSANGAQGEFARNVSCRQKLTATW